MLHEAQLSRTEEKKNQEKQIRHQSWILGRINTLAGDLGYRKQSIIEQTEA